MSWLMIVLSLVAAFLVLVPLLTYLSARRQVGKRIETESLGIKAGDRMIYFYSANCSPCRSMTPIIDQLAETSDRVVKIDIQGNPEMARAFNIRATPTTILLKDNQIVDVVLGSRTETQLIALFKRVA